jgi:hypothetical protein
MTHPAKPALRSLRQPYDTTKYHPPITQEFGNVASFEPSVFDYHDGIYGWIWESGATQNTTHTGKDFGHPSSPWPMAQCAPASRPPHPTASEISPSSTWAVACWCSMPTSRSLDARRVRSSAPGRRWAMSARRAIAQDHTSISPPAWMTCTDTTTSSVLTPTCSTPCPLPHSIQQQGSTRY